MRPPAVLALLLAFALAACGDDDGARSVTPSPSPSATPVSTPSPSASITPTAEQLAYIGADGEIRIVEADGSNDHVFSDTPCDAGDSVNVKDISMSWAPDGSALAFICGSDVAPRQTLLVLDADGKKVAGIPDVSGFRWSPDSTRLAYQRSAEPDVGLLDPFTGTDRILRRDAVLMEWIGPDSLLLGLEPVFGDFGTAFKAHLIRLASGEATALPEFNNAIALWVGPDGAKAIELAQQRDPNGSGPGMAVYDFAQDLVTVIDGGYIGYPSDFIPHQQLAFSPDSASIYWANAADAPASVWTATLGDPVAERLGEVDSLFVAVSPSGRVAALEPPQGGAVGIVVIHDPAAGTRAEVGRGSGPFAWREVAP